MITIPAMAAPNTGQKPVAQGPESRFGSLVLDRARARLNVVLVEPKIPPNTGNVARLCAVTGSRLHLVAPLGFRIDDKDLKRAGLDYWDKVHASTWTSFDEMLAAERVERERLHLFTGHGGRGLWQVRFAPGDWLVMGDEVGGLPQSLLDRFAARQVRVPMIPEPSARSLNLSTCTGIAVYEALRQIHTPRELESSG
jgi:tRNA (cytidine/uridine-2'-O-)-methyltransferase